MQFVIVSHAQRWFSRLTHHRAGSNRAADRSIRPRFFAAPDPIGHFRLESRGTERKPIVIGLIDQQPVLLRTELHQPVQRLRGQAREGSAYHFLCRPAARNLAISTLSLSTGATSASAPMSQRCQSAILTVYRNDDANHSKRLTSVQRACCRPTWARHTGLGPGRSCKLRSKAGRRPRAPRCRLLAAELRSTLKKLRTCQAL